MTTYGYQTAKQTTGYGIPPTSAPAVSHSTALSPYAGQTAKQTTGADSLYPSIQPVKPLAAPTKNVTPDPVAQPGASAQAAAAPSTLYDYTTDPILQQVQAQSTQAQADAQAQALAQQKQLAIQYGDVDLANSLGDTATAGAAAANPYSVYGQINQQQPKDALALDESLNKNNLFYSGNRVNQQTDLANNYGVQRSNAAGQEQGALQQIQQALLSAQLAARQNVNQAQSDAYNRFLQQLLANPPSAGGDSGGTSSDSSSAASQPGGQGSLVDLIANAVNSPTPISKAPASLWDSTIAALNGSGGKKKTKSGYDESSGSNLH